MGRNDIMVVKTEEGSSAASSPSSFLPRSFLSSQLATKQKEMTFNCSMDLSFTSTKIYRKESSSDRATMKGEGRIDFRTPREMNKTGSSFKDGF